MLICLHPIGIEITPSFGDKFCKLDIFLGGHFKEIYEFRKLLVWSETLKCIADRVFG